MVDASQLPISTEINVNELPPDMGQPKPLGAGKKKLLFLVLIPILLLVFVLGGLWFSNNQKQAKLKSLISNASQASRKGEYDKALSYYSQALQIKRDPRFAGAAIKTIALKGNETGQEAKAFEEAKPYIEALEKMDIKDPGTLLSIGYAYETNGKYEEALKYYEKARELDPKSSDAWFHYGHVLQFLGREKEAQEAYDKAYSLNPNSPAVLIAKANRLRSEGKTREALEIYKKASDVKFIQPQAKSEALIDISLLFGSEANYKEALVWSQKAIEADPTFSPALGHHGFNLYLNSKFDEGEEFLNKAIKANPKISSHYAMLGMIRRYKNNFTEAIEDLKDAISKLPDDNTLFTSGQKNLLKGSYTYELAKTYNKADANLDIVQLLVDAVSLNPGIKKSIILDFNTYGYFSTFAQNAEFLALIK